MPCVNAEDLTSRSGSIPVLLCKRQKSQKDSDVSAAEVYDDDDDDEQGKPEKKRPKNSKSQVTWWWARC